MRRRIRSQKINSGRRNQIRVYRRALVARVAVCGDAGGDGAGDKG